MPKQPKTKYMQYLYLTAVFIGALWLRVQWIKNVSNKPVFDFQAYQDIATNIFLNLGHSLNGTAVAFQGMAYPTVLGYVYKLAGNTDLMTAKIFNVILSMLTLIGIYFILIKITQRKFVIYGAYTITAFLPNYIAYNNVIGTEIFFTFLFVGLIVLQVYEFPKILRYPLWGILIGVTALTKPFFMAYPVVAAAIFWMRHKKIKETFFLLGVLLLMMTLTIAPWTYRNYQKFGRIIPISYNSGYVMYINNNGYNTTGAWMPLEEVDAPQGVKEQVSDILQKKNVKVAHEIEPIIKKQAKEWIGQNPIEFIKLGSLRLQATFFSGSWDIDAWTMNDTKEIDRVYKTWNKKEQTQYLRDKNFSRAFRDMIVYALNSVGILYALIAIVPMIFAFFKKDYKLKDEILLPAIHTLFFIAIYFVYEGQSRYNFPLLFLFAISAMVMMDILIQGMKNNLSK
ncbi:hypothetical protein QBE52_02245 [Clostridiaceae bacterium 35-E11]